MTWKIQSTEPEEATVYSPNICDVTEIGGDLSACRQKKGIMQAIKADENWKHYRK
jgi:hypothetical protein